MDASSTSTICVAIPTYRRGESTLNLLNQLSSLEHRPEQIIVVDQTESHKKETDTKLNAMHRNGEIIWQRLSRPSIPRAMNFALTESDCDIVLFLDDDIEITSEIVNEHIIGHKKSDATVVVGKVRQPWHKQYDTTRQSHNNIFATDKPRYVDSAMAGNMSVDRNEAVGIGGFDENFVRVAYRFEDDFAHRIVRQGGKIYYHPTASILHMKLVEGGTRAFGHHLTTMKPDHSVGAYYFLLRSPGVKHRTRSVLKRLVCSGLTKHHLKKPWWIPATIISEIAGIAWAAHLYIKGPRYIKSGRTPC